MKLASASEVVNRTLTLDYSVKVRGVIVGTMKMTVTDRIIVETNKIASVRDDTDIIIANMRQKKREGNERGGITMKARR